MVSFGDSKHKPVKPLHRLLDVTPLKLALSAKCTIHDVVCPCFLSAVCPCGGAAIRCRQVLAFGGLCDLLPIKIGMYGCEAWAFIRLKLFFYCFTKSIIVINFALNVGLQIKLQLSSIHLHLFHLYLHGLHKLQNKADELDD